MKNCVICDQKGNIVISGISFCAMHAAEVAVLKKRLRADHMPVDAARIALALRKDNEKNYLLRDIPGDLWQKVKLHADMNRTTIRDIILTALREITK